MKFSLRTKSKNLNESGLRPLGRAVLVQTYEPERKKSLIELPDVVQNSSAMVEQRAVVVAIGPTAWDDERVRFLGIPLWRQLRAIPGDKVFVTKYAGFMAIGPKDGKRYRLVNGNDIFCGLQDGVELPEQQAKDERPYAERMVLANAR